MSPNKINLKELKAIIREILREDHGLGFSHNSTSDYGDVPLARDPLNDPLLTGKNESALPAEFGLNNRQSRKYWMDTNGNIYGTQGKSHPEWGEMYLKHIGEPVNSYVLGQMMKKGWIRMLLGWDTDNVYTLFYETKSQVNPPTDRQKKAIKDFAIESHVDVIKDRSGKAEYLEESYKFDDFDWLSSMDGFNKPTDVYYGAVHLGVIISKPEGYVIAAVLTPNGLQKVKIDKNNLFKSKNLAADTLHKLWKHERQGKNI